MNIPHIDMKLTGERISSLRRNCGLSVRQLQDYFGFSSPQAIYKWEYGTNIPSIDNLVMLAKIFHVSMDEIIICKDENQIQEDKSVQEITVETFIEHIEDDDFLVRFGDPVIIQIPEDDCIRRIVCMSISHYEELLLSLPDCEYKSLRLAELMEVKATGKQPQE